MTTKNIFRLRGGVQNYGWGKKGKESLVAALAPHAIGDDFEFSEDQFYAEVCNFLLCHLYLAQSYPVAVDGHTLFRTSIALL